MMTPIYRASATLQINPEDTKVLEYDVETNNPNTSGKDFYQTQYELLKSNTLANRVIEQLGLESALQDTKLAKPFFAEQLDNLRALLQPEKPQADGNEEKIITDAASLTGERPLSVNFLANLSVAPVKNSQIVTIHYDDPNPQKAANIANAVADNFIDMNLERRRDAATYAEKFLKDELVGAKSRLLESETKLNNYAKERGIITTDDKESLTSQKLRALNQSLAEAERDRVKTESEYQQAGNSLGATTTLGNTTVQGMKSTLARLQSEYQAGLTSSRSFENSTIQGLKRELAQLQSEYQAGLTSSRSFSSPTIQSLTQTLAQLQSQYQASAATSGAFENPTVQSLTQTLAQLQSQYQAAITSSEAFANPTIQGLKRELGDLEAEYREKSQIYKPAYPLMVQLKQKIDSVSAQITRESKALNSNTQTNLKQRISELQSQIARESKAFSTNTQTNLKQRIAELQSQIAKETRALDVNTQTNLKQRIAELQDQINRETQALNSNTQSSLKQQIDELQSQIAKETGNINTTVAADLKSKYLAAKQREDALREQLAQQKDEFVSLRDKNVGYQELQREVESNRNIYEGLLNRQKEIGVAGGIGSNNISIVDAAIVPFSVHKPNTRLNLALGAVSGLFLGLVLAFLLEFMDDRIKSTEDLEQLLKLPLLGVSPRSKSKDSKKLGLMCQAEPRSAFAEAFRSLRTNLIFSTREGTPRVLSVTSAAASEGKSTACINLATVMAQSGKTVLLIDTDLRNPSIHKRLGLDNSKGLTNYLTGQDSQELVTQGCQIPDVYVITAGPMSPNPVELLSSERLDQLFALAENNTFDMIVVDMPPVLGLADALIVSNRTNATILSVAMGETHKKALVGAFRRLQQARVNVIGTVAAKAKQGSGYGYHYDYNYYGYGQDKKMLEAA